MGDIHFNTTIPAEGTNIMKISPRWELIINQVQPDARVPKMEIDGKWNWKNPIKWNK